MRTLCLAAAVLLLCGMSTRAEEKADNADKLIGSWEAAKADEGTLPVGSVVTFAKEGKMKVTFKKDGEEKTGLGTYKLDGSKLTVDVTEGGKQHTANLTIKKLDADALTISNEEGKTIEFKRKK